MPGELIFNFLNSAEYSLKFGSPSNPEFVRLVYRNVLRREPSQPEVNFQVGALTAGITRVQLASDFLNSNEFRVGIGARLTAFLLYATLLLRGPSQEEFSLRAAQIQNGVPVRQLVDQIISSPEFSALFM
jgi:hypothetical protein